MRTLWAIGSTRRQHDRAPPTPVVCTSYSRPRARPTVFPSSHCAGSGHGACNNLRPHADVAWNSLPARRHVGRLGGQLRALLGVGRGRRALPLRRAGRQRPGGAHRRHRAHRPGVAHVSAGGAPGTALRMARARTVGSRERPALQRGEAPPRSLRQSVRPHRAMARRALRLRDRERRRRDARRPRQRAVSAEVGRDRRRVHVGRRSSARHPDARCSPRRRPRRCAARSAPSSRRPSRRADPPTTAGRRPVTDPSLRERLDTSPGRPRSRPP